jgi:hypothetical protein
MPDQRIDLVIAGVEKAGTTSLKNYVGEHPAICTHEAREFRYFLNEEQYAQGFESAVKKYFGSGFDSADVRLAKHVGICYFDYAAGRLHEHNPDAQLVLILRNPVDRAYSSFWYSRSRGWEDLETFEQAVDAEEDRIARGGLQSHRCAYLARGDYEVQIRRLFALFGRERVCIRLFEDMRRDPLQVCREIFATAGVDASFSPRIDRVHNRSALIRSSRLARVVQGPPESLRRVVPAAMRRAVKRAAASLNKRRATPPPMQPETRDRLLLHFREKNQRLADLINLDLGEWDT